MKRKMEKILSLLLVCAMLVSLMPVAFAAEKQGEVSVSQESVGNDIYKLVFTAKSSVAMLATSAIVMSYDNTVIQPVLASSAHTDVTPVDKATTGTMMSACAGISKAGVLWSVKDGRSAFSFSVLTGDAETGTDIRAGIPIGEFYFRVINNDTEKMNKSTFRLEKDYSEGSFLKTLFSQQDQAKAWMIGFKDNTILGYGDANAEDSLTLASFTFTNSTVAALGALELSLSTNAVDVAKTTATVTPTLTGTDTEGDPMNPTGVNYAFEPVTAPIGVTYNTTTGKVTVAKEAQSGTIKVTAQGGAITSNQETITITRAPAALTEISLSKSTVTVAGTSAQLQPLPTTSSARQLPMA